MAHSLADVRSCLEKARTDLLNKSNVVAVGVGYKTSAGKKTDDLAIICSVASKQAKQSLSASDMIPAAIDSIPTDVNATGVFRALQDDPTNRFRPAPGGVSIGHFSITAGTFGCVVKRNNTRYILSNNHVLANSNNANPGDAILQPGPFDGGQLANDQIATLTDFVPIEFNGTGGADPCGLAGAISSVLNGMAAMVGSKTRLYQQRISQASNLVDAAIAQPLNDGDILDEILNIGSISGTAEGTLNSNVKKMGRTTGFTTGSIQQVDVTVQVNYGNNQIATFVDQLLTGPISEGGDSGSAVLNDQNQLVGLLYAGSTTSTILNRIQNVFQLLNLTLP